jgi:putative ABC transport system substrate-binding protein
MRRREFLGVLGSAAAAWPLAAGAQQSGRIRRIGVLMAAAESDRQVQSRLAVFRGELQKLGWTDIIMETRYFASSDAETVQRYAKELVALQPDLLLSQNTNTTDALLQQTRVIPIIFAIVSDPIGNGFVASFPRPGGNVTGFTISEPTMGGKWLELLNEIAPSVTRVLVPHNSATLSGLPSAEYYLSSLRTTASFLKIDARAAFVRDASELESAIVEHARPPLGGLVVIPEAFLTAHTLETCRSHLQGREAERTARRGPGKVRTGDQPQDRESPRPHRATDVARPRRRGDRMRAATSEFGTFLPCQPRRAMSDFRG